MNFWSEPLPQDVTGVGLLTGQPLQFYDRQGKKDFGAFFSKDWQQADTQRGKTRIAGSAARKRPAGGI